MFWVCQAFAGTKLDLRRPNKSVWQLAWETVPYPILFDTRCVVAKYWQQAKVIISKMSTGQYLYLCLSPTMRLCSCQNSQGNYGISLLEDQNRTSVLTSKRTDCTIWECQQRNKRIWIYCWVWWSYFSIVRYPFLQLDLTLKMWLTNSQSNELPWYLKLYWGSMTALFHLTVKEVSKFVVKFHSNITLGMVFHSLHSNGCIGSQ